jgi:hypothetical protein
MTLRSKVARCKGNVVRKSRTKDSIAPRTPKGCTCRTKRWKDPSFVIGIEDPDKKRQLRLGTGRKLKVYRKITGLEIVKQIARSHVALRRVKDWTRWKGRPPPKRKKRRQTEQEPVM